ncbi:MAG: hypothetical protein WD314_14225 [Trueperaceae bacterium]
MTVPAWIKPGLWGAVLGAIAAMIIGFNWGGWTTGSSAEKMAVERAEAAVVVAMTPHCIAQAMSDPESAELLTELAAETSTFQRRNFVRDAGWATMPGQDEANRDLAVSCAQALEEMPPA